MQVPSLHGQSTGTEAHQISAIHIGGTSYQQRLTIQTSQCSPSMSIKQEKGYVHYIWTFPSCEVNIHHATFSSGACIKNLTLTRKDDSARVGVVVSPLCVSQFFRTEEKVGLRVEKIFYTREEDPLWVFPLKPGDALEITLDSDVPLQTLVEEDGSIHLPIAGKIHVAGITLDEAKELIIKKLLKLNRTASVQVKINKSVPRTLEVKGDMTRTGTYDMEQPSTVEEFLEREGFILKEISSILLERTTRTGIRARIQASPSNPTLFHEFMNIWLDDGDVIIISKPEYVFLDGDVLAPGPYLWQEGLTLKTLLEDAGGMEGVIEARIIILRKHESKTSTAAFQWSTLKSDENVDPELQPGDIIRVQVLEREPNYDDASSIE